jgi:hypothetical protein
MWVERTKERINLKYRIEMKFRSNLGWKWMCAVAYITICIFDFIIVPMWYGLTRPNFADVVANLPQGDIQVQLEFLRVLTEHHDPYTLKGGGLFHLAFGALLTGSVLSKNKEE